MSHAGTLRCAGTAYSLTKVGEVITSAAATVMVAFAALLVASLESLRTLAPGLIIGIALMLLAAVTLVPAILTREPERPGTGLDLAGGHTGTPRGLRVGRAPFLRSGPRPPRLVATVEVAGLDPELVHESRRGMPSLSHLAVDHDRSSPESIEVVTQ